MTINQATNKKPSLNIHPLPSLHNSKAVATVLGVHLTASADISDI